MDESNKASGLVRIRNWFDRNRWLITWGLFILISVNLFYFLIPVLTKLIPYLQPFSDPTDRIQATGIFASSILTFVLIAVYWKIGKTQDRQLQIQHNQERLMELQYVPRVRTIDVRPGFEDWEIQLKLRNYGNGLAENLSIRTDVMLSNEQEYFPSDQTTYRGQGIIELLDEDNVVEHLIQAEHVDIYRVESNEREFEIEHKGADLPPKDQEVWFEAGPRFRHKEPRGKGGISGTPINRFLKKFSDAGHEQIILIFSIVYEDVNGNEYLEYVLGLFFDFEDTDLDSLTMTDILNQAPPKFQPNMSELQSFVRQSDKFLLYKQE